MKLKDVILSYRKENKISQREFARRAGLSHSLISILEIGYNPQTGKKMSQDFETYKKIANALGISIQELFEKLDDDEAIDLKPYLKDVRSGKTVFVYDSEIFRKILFALSPIDYEVMMEILERTEQKLRDRGEL